MSEGLTIAEQAIRRARREGADFALKLLQFTCPQAEVVVVAAYRCADGETDSTAVSNVVPARAAALLRNAALDYDGAKP
jgi:hypothetical protein